MKYLIILSALLFTVSGQAYAMTQEATHYQGTDTRANATDSDDAEEQFNDAPRSAYQGQSGREQQLLQGGDQDHGSTYGFNSHDSGWSQNGSNFGGGQSGFYYGLH